MWRLSLCPFFKLCCWSPAPPTPLLTCRVACSHVSPRGSRTCHRWPCCSSQSSPHYRSVSTCLRLSPLKSRQWWESFSCESTWLLSSRPPPALSNPGKHNRGNVLSLGFFLIMYKKTDQWNCNHAWLELSLLRSHIRIISFLNAKHVKQRSL